MSTEATQSAAIPPHLAPQEGELVMFANPLLERLSRIRPLTVLLVFVPIAVLTAAYGLSLGTGAGRLSGLFMAGLASWTLFEYLMHKHVFHFFPKGAFQTRLQFIIHGVHHQYPQDRDRLVMPVTISIPAAALLLWIFHLLLGDLAWGYFSGFLCGYIAYDMIHYSVHHWTKIKNPLMRRIRRHHMAHHFRDTNRGFGVSTPIWDKIFHT